MSLCTYVYIPIFVRILLAENEKTKKKIKFLSFYIFAFAFSHYILFNEFCFQCHALIIYGITCSCTISFERAICNRFPSLRKCSDIVQKYAHPIEKIAYACDINLLWMHEFIETSRNISVRRIQIHARIITDMIYNISMCACVRRRVCIAYRVLIFFSNNKNI